MKFQQARIVDRRCRSHGGTRAFSGAVEAVGRRLHLDAELSVDSAAGARAGGDEVLHLHFV